VTLLFRTARDCKFKEPLDRHATCATFEIASTGQHHEAWITSNKQQLLQVLFLDNLNMTPPKTRRKVQSNQPQLVTTDYDTDTAVQAAANYTVSKRTNDELNLSVLLRYLPSIHTILSVANYAVLYTFNPSAQAWQKADIEGTLFVCGLNPVDTGVEQFCVIILNRRGLENFVVDIVNPGDIEISGEYLYVRSEVDGETYGLWIYSEDGTSTTNQREIIHQVIVECAKLAEAARARNSNGLEDEEDVEIVAEEEPESAPMGRQVSLRELFGQQREQDSGFSVHTHQYPRGHNTQPAIASHISNPPPPHPTGIHDNIPPTTIVPPTAVQDTEAPRPVPPSQFQMSADTAFFMSVPSLRAQSSATSTQQSSQPNGTGNAKGDALLALFRSAK